MNLEVCANSLESALNAMKGGANRIELCSNLLSGGITPSIGTIGLASDISNLSIRVMIRPRSGDFLYSDMEFETMKKDIEYCKKMKIEGVVFGLLLSNGKIDIKRTKELINLARPMKVTFHRAFDMCENHFTALHELIDLGIDTVLTSGGQKKAIDGVNYIKKMVKLADNKIEIMVGSGVRPHNVKHFFDIGIRSFHLSGTVIKESEMIYRNTAISMGNNTQISEYNKQFTDVNIIKSMNLELKRCVKKL